MPAMDKKGFQEASKWAAVFALLCWLVFGLFLENAILAGLFALPCFFILFAVLAYYPKMQKKGYGQKVEACMPFSLMNIAVELSLGAPFMQALKNAGRGRNCCAKEFRKALLEIEGQGASVQEALRHLCERVESSLVKRAVTQLAASFEHSGKESAEPIKRIAGEMLTRQRLESKLFSGKMVVSSLLFIAVSAIVPALFQSFSIVGSAILKMSFNATQLFLIIAIGFPLLDIAVLIYIRSRTPAFLRGG